MAQSNSKVPLIVSVVVGVVLIAIVMFRPQGLLGKREELLFAK